jgi:hypothetical protein
MPAASTTRQALKTLRGSRPKSAPTAGIECVTTAHKPPLRLADATAIDRAVSYRQFANLCVSSRRERLAPCHLDRFLRTEEIIARGSALQ